MPANAVEVTATYDAAPITIGSESITDITQDASGTNWSWDASNRMITITGDIMSGIRFYTTIDISVNIVGEVAISSLDYTNADAGKLTISGSGTLKLEGREVIDTYNDLEISDVTVSLKSNNVNGYTLISIDQGDFIMSSGKLLLDCIDSNSECVYCENGDILISGTAEVKTNSTTINTIFLLEKEIFILVEGLSI
ncbi:hypothetical protein [Anaerovorax sp. IOR16]|uniref:hypothetical protein n=1 Tax=Anaerovorax sp. IOR16 TaxID=2773458 RepID=UPI0019D0F3FB|nr:hypothetical protein [Anaerovorax sp. IOR16]